MKVTKGQFYVYFNVNLRSCGQLFVLVFISLSYFNLKLFAIAMIIIDLYCSGSFSYTFCYSIILKLSKEDCNPIAIPSNRREIIIEEKKEKKIRNMRKIIKYK